MPIISFSRSFVSGCIYSRARWPPPVTMTILYFFFILFIVFFNSLRNLRFSFPGLSKEPPTEITIFFIVDLEAYDIFKCLVYRK